MASGINGPGNREVMANLSGGQNQRLEQAAQVSTTPPAPVEGSAPDVTDGATGQFQGPGDLADNHLSFSDLMAHQNKEDTQAATDARRMAAYPQGGLRETNLASAAYNPSLHMDTSLNQEIEKVFEEEPTTIEPSQLRMDFANPSMAGETTNYPGNDKYGERDFSSHRRSNVHMYQPMATHLSSRDMKTIQSAHGTRSSEEKSTKRRRHRSSSSSGSLSSSSVTKKDRLTRESKAKKKKSKKDKKTKRKSLTAQMRNQTTGIPEEDEDESDDDSDDDKDDEEEDENDQDGEESGRDQDRDGRNDDGRSDGDNKERAGKEEQKKDRKESSPGGGNKHSGGCNDQIVFVAEEVDGKPTAESNVAVLFTVGADDTPKHVTDVKAGGEAPSSPKQQNSGGSLQSSSSSSSSCSSSSVSESEEKDKLNSLVDLKKHAEEKLKNKKHKHHHHHHHKRKHQGVKIQRRLSGQKLKDLDEKKASSSEVGPDELGLEKVDIEEMKSHRLDDRVGVRKHLLHRPVKKRKIRTELQERKVHDRKPHEVFVELDELVAGEWRETARWIKFEEDVEESQMWGKPRVASLSFHSLLELRKTIEKGAVMLDLEKQNLTDISNAVVDEMVKTGQIKAEDQGNVLRVLLSKHKHHVLETGLQYNFSKASFSGFFNSQSYAARLNAAGHVTEPDAGKPLLNPADVADVERGQKSPALSRSDNLQVPSVSMVGPSAKDIKIMKKIPDGAEATAVLVGTMDYLEQPTMAFVRLASGTDLENVVALPIPVRFLFVLLGPKKPDYNYHEIGRSISTLMADQEFRVMAYAAEDRSDLLRAINEFLDDSIVLPPGQLENPDLVKNISKYQDFLAQRNQKKKRKAIEEKGELLPAEEKDPLQRTKRCFGGLIADVKRRYPLYLSDIKDAFNLQCLASIIFIYFAALSPAITFGGLLGEKTDGFIGVSEMLLGCCLCGCMFGLFSGQPMLIVGSTGPLLVFEEAVYNFALGGELPYLATRFWIGLWICIICVIVVAFEGSFLVRYVTRFTQEIFTALIALIFIYETFNKLARTYAAHPLLATYPVPLNETEYSLLYNCSFTDNQTFVNGSAGNRSESETEVIMNQPNTALLSTLLMFGTFIIAYFLRQFKNSKFLRSSVRRTIGDFGVPIAIVIMLIVDVVITDTYTQKLDVPKGISPTDPSKRGWLVSPLGTPDNPMPVWMIFASAIPAFLVFILIFMESHITEVIVSAKERRLKKGTGFHLNLLVLGILNLLVSVFGMPWVCCAAVRSITHTNSLTVMSKTQAPGEKPRIEGLLEQRVTVFVVNACLGLSILMQPLLQEIPLAVLFGIFLYMGVTSLTGVQYMDRLEMLFMPAKHYPDFSYVNAVRAMKIHIFTLIETVCLVILWIVKSTPASIAFPFALVLTIPLRFFILPRIFTQKEISELDGTDDKPSVTSSNLDEYHDSHLPD